MSWIVNIAGKAEDFLNKIDQTTAVALQSGESSNSGDVRPKKAAPRRDYEFENNSVEPLQATFLYTSMQPVSLANSVISTAPTDLTKTSEIGNSNAGRSRPNSRPKPPRPSKLRNTNASKAMNSELIINGTSNNNETVRAAGSGFVKQEQAGNTKSSTDEQLLDFLNSPSQDMDESCLLKNEIASQSREMSLLLRNYKKLQQDHEALKKTYEFSRLQTDPTNNAPYIVNDTSSVNNFDVQLTEKNQEIENLRSQLKSVLAKIDSTEETKAIKNRIEQLELENQLVLSENQEMKTKLNDTTIMLQNCEKQTNVIKEKLSTLEKEYFSYKDKAKIILQSKDDLIANMSSGNSNYPDDNQSSDSVNSSASPGSQYPAESQFLSEIGSLRSERELLQAEITQNRFYTDSLREENNRLETELQSLRISSANTYALYSKEKQIKHNYQEENLKLSQQISTLQLEFERERIEKVKLKEKLEAYDTSAAGSFANTSSIRKSNSLNEFEISSQQKYGLDNDYEETETLRTRITALSQSLLEKQNYVNALSADKQLLQLRIERLQSKVEEMNQEVEYHQSSDSFNFGRDELTTDLIVSSQPLYLSESPWDSRIARRVKRAYAQVDTFCCQIGLILRQRPNIRLGFCMYILFLHLWVFFVLFSWSHNHTSEENVKI